MADTIRNRFRKGWTAFTKGNTSTSYKGGELQNQGDYGVSYGSRPDRVRLRASNDKSIINSVYTRIGIDVAAIDVKHVRVDQNGRFVSEIQSGLNECLTMEANLDQAARAFRQDAVMTLFDKGVIAIVPVETDSDPTKTDGFEIRTMRVGEIVQWYPNHVRISMYNDLTGNKDELTLPKSSVAIVENPLYAVMNEPNSTLQRLIRKLAILDSVDEQAGSGKLDLIIQLPYVIKSEARQQQAENRRKDLEVQLKQSQYGIAYTDGTEKITQLNRPAENNMLKQIEYLSSMLYGQLGLTEDVFTGSADEKTMLNYHNRTIEPVLSAITDAMKRSFLSRTARTQGQSIEFFRDPFKLVSINVIADIADKFSRNEIMSSNEIRSVLGIMPSKDPKAEELRNSNMPQPGDPGGPSLSGEIVEDEIDGDEELVESEDEVMSEAFDEIEATIDKLLAELDDEEDTEDDE